MKPFYKFSLPPLEVNPMEMDAWVQVKEERIDVSMLKDLLINIKMEIGDTYLSSRSQAFITLEDLTEMEKFVDTYRSQPLKRLTVITCITTIKKTVTDE